MGSLGTPLPLCATDYVPCSPQVLQNPTGKQKHAKKNYSVASGGKVVNVLVPFTKPQPKKVTLKIPERKW